jgi:hypothetical protein
MNETNQVVAREKPDMDPADAAYVESVVEKIRDAKDHWSKKFERMRANQKYARDNRLFGEEPAADDYRVNITFQSMQRRTAALYARNPTVIVKPKKKMMFKVWDGKPESYMLAAQNIMQGLFDPEDEALLMEVQAAKDQQTMLSRLAQTATLVYKNQVSEPKPKFKPQLKQAVRRALTNGVAYAKVGYQRKLDYPSHLQSAVRDATSRLAELERLSADVADGEISDTEAEMAEMRAKLQALQSAKILVRDGLTFSFPRSTAIIVDPECTQLKGFVGAGWIAEEFLLTPKRVQEIFGVDIKKEFKARDKDGRKSRKSKDNYAAVYAYYDLVGQVYAVVCDGYCDWLEPPGEPPVQLEKFHPYSVLSFGDLEDEDDIYPLSHVEAIRPMNVEIQRSRQALREHRIANRPAMLNLNSAISGTALERMESHRVNEVIPVSLPAGSKITDALAPKPTQPIQEAVYETESVYTDALRVSGDQDANNGPASGDATATEASIAENSRMSGLESNKDDLDEFLGEFAEDAIQVLLTEMDPNTVAEIAGPGAIWPQYTPEQVFAQMDVELVAGSSGRPNRGLQISNMERLTPLLLQVPGVQPTPVAKRLAMLMDDDIDIDEFVQEGLPSILSLNRMSQMSTGDPATDPNAQGPQGANKQPAPDDGADAVGEPANPSPGNGQEMMQNQM